MVQHIDISVLLAEIEREYKSLSNATDDFAMGRKAELKNILSFLGALEVKEEVTTTDAFIKKAKEAFCKATCNGHPPRSTCTSLGTCKEYDNFVKLLKRE